MNSEPNTPESYANALLTTMARARSGPITIVPGVGVPPLAPLAVEPTERDWIASLPFSYGDVDANRVIAAILAVSGYRVWHLSPRSYELTAIVATGDNLKPIPVRFRVERSSRLSGPITITRVGTEQQELIDGRFALLAEAIARRLRELGHDPHGILEVHPHPRKLRLRIDRPADEWFAVSMSDKDLLSDDIEQVASDLILDWQTAGPER